VVIEAGPVQFSIIEDVPSLGYNPPLSAFISLFTSR
jgi:hypothetical protein